MSKFQLHFHLKQHTPIIHFQHNQKGATLRATELKPKLDKFIISKMNKAHEKIPKEWYNNKNSLNYKVRIEANDTNKDFYLILAQKDKKVKYFISDYNEIIGKSIYPLCPTPYFAMFDTYKKCLKKNKNSQNQNELFNKIILGVKTNNKIAITIFCFNESLKQTIEKIFPEFLCLENFGTRQNKGFGCFYEETTQQKDLENILKNNFENVYLAETKSSNLSNIFSNIDKIYKDIKNNPLNKTSSLKQYYENHNIKWEKELIKKKFFTSIPNDNIQDISKYKFVRALLGLADNYSYPQQNMTIKISDSRNQKKQNEKINENIIERFKSPILFKVFNNTIYIIPQEIDERMLNVKFDFYSVDEPTKKLTLETPDFIDVNAILYRTKGIKKL